MSIESQSVTEDEEQIGIEQPAHHPPAPADEVASLFLHKMHTITYMNSIAFDAKRFFYKKNKIKSP